MNSARSRGFTLIEVVVAFLLLSVVLVTTFEIFSRGLARAGELDEYAQALVIAQGRLASAGVDAPLAEGATAGDSEDGRYRWSMSIGLSPEGGDPARPMQGGYRLYQVEARVTWQSAAGTERAVSLVTLQLAQVK